MKAINFKLATFSFAALLLASCSDSNDINSGSTERNTTVVGSAVTSVTDAQELAARVHNLKVTTSSSNSTNTKTRAAKAITRAVTDPTIPEGAQKLSSISEKYNEHAGTYYVDSGEKVSGDGMNINGMTIYVKGKFTYGTAYGENNSIIVLSGGTLVARTNDSKIFASTKISNYGTIVYPESQTEYYIANTFYNFAEQDLDFSKVKLTLAGGEQCLYVNGNLKAKEITMTGSGLIAMGDVTTEKLYMTAGNSKESSATINGTLTTTAKGKETGDYSLKLDNSSELSVGCAIKSSGLIYVTNSASVDTKYIKATEYTQDSNASIKLHDQSMFDISGTYNNQNNGDGSINLAETGVAVVKCNKVKYNAGWAQGAISCKVFTTTGENANIIIDSKEGFYNNNDKKIEVEFSNAGNVYLASEDNAKNFTIKKTECNTNGWNDDDSKKDDDDSKKDDDKEKTPGTLDKITVIDYDKHEHDISATGIMPFGENMYMSYHTRGSETEDVPTGHGGCVEVFSQVSDNKVTMKQYLYDTARDLDFNHLLAVQHDGKKKIYLPGSSNKKGAILGYMDILDNGLLNSQSTAITSETTEEGKKTVTYQEPLQFIQMNPATKEFSGYDENCVVYNDKTKHLIVMTTAGYLVYDLDYNEVAKVAKPGKAKHVAIGNGKIATLYFTERNSDTEMALPAKVEIFDAATEDLTNPTTSFNISTIQPNNGKNVIAIDGNNLYVCRGAAGMYVYDMTSGDEVWHYQMPNAQIEEETSEKKGQYKALANGLFVDDKYVYVAYGSHGLVVLDKTTHKVIARRAESKSANYVYVHNGYIYVAYGQDRLQVFKLYPNGISGTDTDYSKN